MSPPSKSGSNSGFLASLLAPTLQLPAPTSKGNGKSWVVSLTGTAGDDVFDPGTGIGASTMTGGGGNDVFYVHSGGDKVVVPPGQGSSTIILEGNFANYVLPANVANLVADAPIPMDLVGNSLDNIIRANGLGDTLDGGGGADTLVGGAGRDTFVVTKGNGSDTLVAFQTGADADVVSLRGFGLTSFSAVQAAMQQSGANVVLALGNGQTATFTDHAVKDFVAANFGMPNVVVPVSGPPTTTASGGSASPPSPPTKPPTGAGGSPPSGGGGTPAPSSSGLTYAPSIPQAAGGAAIVGLNLQNPTATALAGRFVTFGQEFAPGQVPAGSLLQAMINGVTEAVQMDVKATNPDGSVRMAVLTLAQPPLPAGATVGVMLSRAPAGTPSGTPVDIGALAHDGYSVTVDLSLHNANGVTTPFHIDAGQALAQALAHRTASTWLSGPDATQVRVDVPVAGSLHVSFDVTAYADGSTSTDVQFNNDDAMTASGGTVTYDATIRQNGATAFSQSNIKQFQYQTWHEMVASNGAPQVNVQHDVAALEAAGFVQNYDLSTGVATSAITAETTQMAGNGTAVTGTPSFGILGNAGVTQYMPQTGGRPDISPTTLANTLWLMTQNASAGAYALAQADAAGSVPWHFYSSATGTDVTTAQYPTLWSDPRGGSIGGTVGLTQPVPAYGGPSNQQSGWSPDPAHQPDLSYDAYLLTGSRYYLDQLNAQASYDILQLAPAFRQNGQDIMASGQAQVRAQAWDLRDVQEAAFINPDNAPLKAYFAQAVNDTFTYLLNTVVPAANASEGQADGWLAGAYGSAMNTIAPWEQDYFGQVVVMAAEQGNAQAKQVLDWESNFLVGRFLQAQNGFDPRDGVAYNLVTGPSATSDYQSWAQIEQATKLIGQAADFSGAWTGLEYPGYRAWALATLAGDYTVEQTPQAIQAYGWLEANAGVNAAWQAANPQYDIVPRLADGTLLDSTRTYILTGSASGSVGFGNGDELIYDSGTGNNTITGGSGIDILFGGAGKDLLIGGAANDYLFGGSGAVTLSGGAGSNWLQAGTGGTQFNLSTGDAARDVISGFVPGRDTLHVTGAGGTPLSAAQLQALLGTETIASGSLTLTLAPAHSVTLTQLAPAQLTAANFV